jgi:A/G-specific adenine glycosylase
LISLRQVATASVGPGPRSAPRYVVTARTGGRRGPHDSTWCRGSYDPQMMRTSWSPEERFRRAIFGTFRASGRSFPWRESRDPYAVLVAEVLLQRTRGENAVATYSAFLARWPDGASLGSATEAEVADVIRPLGLHKRAGLLVRLGQSLRELGGVPLDPELLVELPGVGPYAAHAVPVFVAGRSLPVVDWVIARVLRRYFGLAAILRPNADRALWECAATVARPGRARELWLGTLDFAATTCGPKPKCRECPLRQTCSFFLGEAAS